MFRQRDPEPLAQAIVRQDLDGREPPVALDNDEAVFLFGREQLLMLPEAVRQNGVDQLVHRLVAPQPAQNLVLLVDGEILVRKARVRGIEVQVGRGVGSNLQGNQPFPMR